MLLSNVFTQTALERAVFIFLAYHKYFEKLKPLQ
jgi:hypothetical protein